MNESTLEQAALDWFQDIGFTIAGGADLSPEGHTQERASFSVVFLEERLRAAIQRLNPDVPADGLEEAFRKVTVLDAPTLIARNRQFHNWLRDGVEVEYARPDGSIKGDRVRLFDFDHPTQNDFLAVNQMVIRMGNHKRIPDIVVFVNGLPLAIVELKKLGDDNATIDHAYQQLQTYKNEIPTLFDYNELLVISDGSEAKLGSLTAGIEWFKPWPTIDSDQPVKGKLALETLIRGVFEPKRFLSLVREFVLFEEDSDSDQVFKVLAGYHQFHAVHAAVTETLRATHRDGAALKVGEPQGRFWAGEMAGGKPGDQRCGVVWHTQGSGKSFSMLFYAGLVISRPEMKNPTIVVLTDRNDLDDQLFGQFQRCSEILRQKPIQADSVENLRELLKVGSGGVIFTTVHKFSEESGKFPLLTDRSNVVVMADEAHRSQYGFRAKRTTDKATGEDRFSYGFARNIRDALPNASFIGFTGTPVELSDKNTKAVFGDYISIYDIQRAVQDKATVPIFYEARVIKLSFSDAAIESIDEDFEEVTESEEETTRERLKTKWAALEAMVGDDDRLKVLARDLVNHFEKRLEAIDGKGMVVCMSRRICVDLYNEIISLRPEWHSEDDEQGFVKIIMTGSAADGPEWQQHIRSKERRKTLATQFKKPSSPFKLVIVRDMWLTGFDCPSAHTMYIDKPMQGHGLMQAIARVNRVFGQKTGGLIVDYLGIGDSLQQALRTYTESGGEGKTTIDLAEAIAALQKQYELCCDMLHGLDWTKWVTGTPSEQATLPQLAQEHILEQEDGKSRWQTHVSKLSQAFALCPVSDYALEIREGVAFFQIVATMMRKYSSSGKTASQLDLAVRQLVSKAVITAQEDVIDVFSAAGMERPDVSILSEEFLDEVRALPHKNLAVELLRKLLSDEIKVRCKRNVVQARAFSDMLQATMNSYHNRAISNQEIIEELINVAHKVRAAADRGEELNLTEDEICFYDALIQNNSAEELMGDDKLKVIATGLVLTVRRNVSIDWTLRENARARIRVIVKRILKKFGYPPDLQDAAVKLVLEQAETLSEEWAVES
ncbi:MAG: type I restriction endonuclease subunit R [Pirellula sp.]|nr:type I restriction endonuclease subunit R [Pirellula sp.]